MKDHNITAGAVLMHSQLTRQGDPEADLLGGFRSVPPDDRGEVLLAAAVYGLAMSRALLLTLAANGIDASEALARHGEELRLNDLYHQPSKENPND